MECINNDVFIGERCDKENNFTQMNVAFFFKPNVQFDTFADFADETVWNTKIIAGDIIPIHGIVEVTRGDAEPPTYTSTIGRKINNGDAIKGMSFDVKYDILSHTALKSMSGKNYGIMRADTAKNVFGTSPDGTVVKPFNLQYLYVSSQMESVGADPAFTNVDYQYTDTQEWDTDGVYLSNPVFLPTSLMGVTQVTAEQFGTISANSYVVDVAFENAKKIDGQNLGASTSISIDGLLAANFQTLDGSGVDVPILTATESTTVPGRYTITHTTFTAGTSQVLPSATAKYKSTALTLS